MLGLIQDFTLETDSLRDLEKWLDVALSLLGCQELELFVHQDGQGLWVPRKVFFVSQSAYMEVITHRGPGDYWPVCSVHQCKDWRHTGDEPAADPEKQKEIVQQVVQVLAAIDRAALIDYWGNTGLFDDLDGGVGPGYRLNYSSHQSGLLISLCDIYYPK